MRRGDRVRLRRSLRDGAMAGSSRAGVWAAGWGWVGWGWAMVVGDWGAQRVGLGGVPGSGVLLGAYAAQCRDWEASSALAFPRQGQRKQEFRENKTHLRLAKAKGTYVAKKCQNLVSKRSSQGFGTVLHKPFEVFQYFPNFSWWPLEYQLFRENIGYFDYFLSYFFSLIFCFNQFIIKIVIFSLNYANLLFKSWYFFKNQIKTK